MGQEFTGGQFGITYNKYVNTSGEYVGVATGTVNINGGGIYATYEKTGDLEGANGITHASNCKLNITNGYIEAYHHGIAYQALTSGSMTIKSSTITVTGPSAQGYDGIYLPNEAKGGVTVSNSTITGNRNAILNDSKYIVVYALNRGNTLVSREGKATTAGNVQ